MDRAKNQELKRRLKTAREDKECLKEQLEVVENNMLSVIERFEARLAQEKQELVTVHSRALREEQAANIQHRARIDKQERELALREEWLDERDKIISNLCDEGNTWMERFATVMRGSQYLPELVERAEQMADVFSTPGEITDLFDYCKHMIELMKEIVRKR